jgi:predicted transcriptional regulator YdeE
MEKQQLTSFFVIGITVRTSNQNGQAAQDIPALWQRFYSENVSEQIKGSITNDVYSVYTEYDGDYMQPYTTLIGHRVENLDYIPDGMRGIIIAGGEFAKWQVKGDLSKGLVFNAWTEIWNTDLQRAYQADFEVYNAAADDPRDVEAEIYVGLL